MKFFNLILFAILIVSFATAIYGTSTENTLIVWYSFCVAAGIALGFVSFELTSK